MNRIDAVFSALRPHHECALIPYLTGGFPAPDRTLELLLALDRGGADVIELGVPFSDPIADGPTIQRASAEALAAGTTLPLLLDIVREFRKQSDKPVVLFGAYNPFFHYGLEKVASDAAAAGADGFLIADMPADEAPEVLPTFQAAGMKLIHLVAPTTPASRKAEICRTASGFLYYISLKGVTGARTSVQFDLEQPLRELRECTDLPVAVGFGIGTPEQAAMVAKLADAVVVGSALIDLICSNRDASDLAGRVEKYIRSLKDAITGRSALRVPAQG